MISSKHKMTETRYPHPTSQLSLLLSKIFTPSCSALKHDRPYSRQLQEEHSELRLQSTQNSDLTFPASIDKHLHYCERKSPPLVSLMNTQRQGRWCWLLLSLMKGLVSPKSCTLVRQRHWWFSLLHDDLKGSADNSVFKTLVGLTLAIYHMPTQATAALLLSLNSIGEEQNTEKLRSWDKDKITYEVLTQAKWTWFEEN